MRSDPATDPRNHGEPADHRMTALYEQHAGPLRRLLLQLTLGQAQLADDLLEETMARAWRQRDRLPDDAATMRTWLFTVARRIAIAAVRSRSIRPATVAARDLAAEVPEDQQPIATTARSVHTGLARLSPDHRRVLLEVYVNGRSCREAAQVLGISEDAVKSLAYHALRSLRTVLDS